MQKSACTSREPTITLRRRPVRVLWLVLIALVVTKTLFLDARLVKETIVTCWFEGSTLVQSSSISSSPSRRNSNASASPKNSSLAVLHDLFTAPLKTKSKAMMAQQQQQQQQNIRYIHLLGERNSGTNYIAQVLSSAFYPQYHREVWDKKCRFVCGIPVFQFKHAFRHNLLSPTEIETLRQPPYNDVLWILVVRSPCDWADAMYRTPWHLCTSQSQCAAAATNNNNNNKNPEHPPPLPPVINIAKLPAKLTRAKFWSTFPWLDYKEAAVLGNYSTTDFSYRNVFALRKHKLMLMQQLMEAVPYRVHIVHLKTVERAPEALVERLRVQFGLFVNATTYKPVKPSRKPHSKPLCLNSEEFAIAQKEIDWELESRFGFTPLDCHLCMKSGSS